MNEISYNVQLISMIISFIARQIFIIIGININNYFN